MYLFFFVNFVHMYVKTLGHYSPLWATIHNYSPQFLKKNSFHKFQPKELDETHTIHPAFAGRSEWIILTYAHLINIKLNTCLTYAD